MAHEVKFSVPVRVLGKSGLVVRVWRTGTRGKGRRLYGRLKISQGRIAWAKAGTEDWHEGTWQSFAGMMRRKKR